MKDIFFWAVICVLVFMQFTTICRKVAIPVTMSQEIAGVEVPLDVYMEDRVCKTPLQAWFFGFKNEIKEKQQVPTT